MVKGCRMVSQLIASNLSSVTVRRVTALSIYPELLRLESELRGALEAAEAAKIDPLTGANVRAAYDLFVATRPAQVLHQVVFDVQYFKDINDSRGHQTGDRVLRYVGESIRIICETYGLPVRQRFYRYGGDELVLFVEPEAILAVARAIHLLTLSSPRADEYEDLPRVILNYGCGRDFEAADRELYQVKHQDR
jgi:chemotaxis family two-component system sensor kinase Cph1